MNNSFSERRLAENEVYFREHNENVQKGFDEINRIATEQGDDPHIYDSMMLLAFYCECSDEKCDKRVELSLDDYNTIHQNNKAFVIVPGHEVVEYEHVIYKKKEFYVVEKYVAPPETAETLNSSDVDNT